MVARTLLATEKVRYVGECVAVVVTETRAQGEDAAGAVIVDIDPLEALVDVEAAMTSTTLIYEGAGSNVVFDTTVLGMPENTGDAFFDDCEVVVKGRFMNQRVAPCPMEVRGSAAAWVDGRLHQWISTQHAQGVKDAVVAHQRSRAPTTCASSPPTSAADSAPRSRAYAEELLLGAIAKKVGRPVVWRETRSEIMVALGHGRAQLQYVTIGGTRDGKVTHYQLHAIQDAGGFADMGTILAPFMTRPMSSGVYAIPNIEVRTTSVVTNTTPIVAYRGAGRPEATAAVERAMDMFALEIGKDPAEVRRINLIPKFLEPHTTAIGQTYDVGDFEARARQGARRRRLHRSCAPSRQRAGPSGDAKQLGIGVSVYVEITGGVPPMGDDAKIEVLEDGRAVVYTGTSPHGQGHATAFSMIASEQTGIPMDQHRPRLGRHRSGPRRWRHDGLPLAAAGRRGGQPGRGRARRAGHQARRPLARSRRGRRRARQGHRRVPRRRHARRVQDVGRPRRSREGRRRPQAGHHVLGGERDVPVRRPRRRRRGRHRDRPGQATSATSPATTPVGC